MKVLKFLKFWHLPKKIWIPALLIISGGLFFVFSPKQKPIPINTVSPETGTVREVISASGTLEGTDSADLRFKIGGKLNYMGVEPGDKVTKGKLIASLDLRDLQVALQQAQNNFESKDATAKRAEDDVKDNDTDETFTQKEERTLAQKARDSAFDSVKAAQRALEDAYIYAPLSGIVTKADPNAGQIVTAADVIAQIVDESDYVFEAEVDESDLGSIQIGQKATVAINSYPDRNFDAVVSKITPSISKTDSGATVVIVKLDLGKPNINFVSGLNGQADIILKEATGVKTLPIEALMDGDQVYIKNGENYEKIKVETGLKSDSAFEVKSGLTDQAQVVTNPEDVPVKQDNWLSKITGK